MSFFKALELKTVSLKTRNFEKRGIQVQEPNLNTDNKPGSAFSSR